MFCTFFCTFARFFTEIAMYLRHLSILNYRNIEEADLELSPKFNCFVGLNGQGKTNLLDAVYFLSFTRSATNVVDGANIRHDADFFMLNGAYEDAESGDVEQVACSLRRGGKKVMRRNGKAYKRLSEHIGLLPIISISPLDEDLISGGSEGRRHFMDAGIAQYDANYIFLLNKYNKALQQRNVLLRQQEANGTAPDLTLLGVYEEVMAEAGEGIFAARQYFIELLTPGFQQFYEEISQSGEVPNVEYVSHAQRGPLLEVIQRDRAKDLIMGYSLHGIHRDDLEITLGGHAAKKEASQGQSKTFQIALKLALYQLLKESKKGNLPMLLLDDIFDKLDAKRVEHILQVVASKQFGQIFITDTSGRNMRTLLDGSSEPHRLFSVQGGVFTEVKEDEA